MYPLYANNILTPGFWLLTSFFNKIRIWFCVFHFLFFAFINITPLQYPCQLMYSYPLTTALKFTLTNIFVLPWSFSFSLLNTQCDILDTFFLPLYFFIKYTTIKKVLYLIFFYDIIKIISKQKSGLLEMYNVY